jgi:hypothetical protein
MLGTISLGSGGDEVKRLRRALARHSLWNPFVQALPTWAGLPANRVLDDDTCFTPMEPGWTSQLPLEAPSNLTDGLL